jgi:prepilin-type N-terminal cleavage/methylation domain-containing protein
MNRKKHNKKRKKVGFTIIEVMIVLAIAGIIMVIVLLAVRAAQQSRRDAERKSYLQILYTTELNYLSHNRTFPGCDGCTSSGTAVLAQNAATRFIKIYMPEGTDPSTRESYKDTSTLLGNDSNGPYIGNSSDSVRFYYDANTVSHEIMPSRIGQIVITVGHYCIGRGPQQSADVTISGADMDMSRIVSLIGTEKGGYYCVDNTLK